VSEARVTLLGLPLTGKSTFIGALWHFVEEPSIDSIREASLPGDRSHVQALADHVRELSEIDRTGHDADERFEVPVEFPGAGTVTLVIPDHSGEQLQGLVERRIWPELLREELATTSALILFVNPDTTRPPLELHLLDGTAHEQGEQPEYSNSRACTAAQLIDGLESVIEATRERWPMRVAVAISAFDRVGDVTPAEWLDKRLPALAAMLANDPARVQSATFGISAQGGRREDAEALVKHDLHERAWARSADGTPVPLSDPVRWALGWG
jgi:Double-GTPase 1